MKWAMLLSVLFLSSSQVHADLSADEKPDYTKTMPGSTSRSATLNECRQYKQETYEKCKQDSNKSDEACCTEAQGTWQKSENGKTGVCDFSCPPLLKPGTEFAHSSTSEINSKLTNAALEINSKANSN